MTWRAIIPLRGRGERKTRLAGRLSAAERSKLSERMFVHVVRVLRQSEAISDVALLSNLCPKGWEGAFFADQDRGLNLELSSLADRLERRPLLVIHADLPLLEPEDIAALLTEARHGIAIAPDRAGSGTNAIALLDPTGFNFAFGCHSLASHLTAAHGKARLVKRIGLGLDIDTAEDLDAAIALGFPILSSLPSNAANP